jgi:hypothetical protein
LDGKTSKLKTKKPKPGGKNLHPVVSVTCSHICRPEAG